MMYAVCMAFYQHVICEINCAARTVNIMNMLSGWDTNQKQFTVKA